MALQTGISTFNQNNTASCTHTTLHHYRDQVQVSSPPPPVQPNTLLVEASPRQMCSSLRRCYLYGLLPPAYPYHPLSHQTVSGLGVESVNGAKVMYWTEGATTSSRGGSTLQTTGGNVDFNYAYHTSSPSLTQHSVGRSVRLNLLSGGTEDTTDRENKQKVKTHAAYQVMVWAFVMPIGILVKRYGPTFTDAKVSTFPIPFLVHALLMVVGIILTIAMAILALVKFNGGTEHAHKEIGIAIMVGCGLQIVMQVAKPDAESSKRIVFKIVHMCVGILTMILAITTLFTGAENYERLYPDDDEFASNIRITVIVAMIVWFFVAVILAIVTYMKNKKEKQKKKQHEQEMERANQYQEGKVRYTL